MRSLSKKSTIISDSMSRLIIQNSKDSKVNHWTICCNSFDMTEVTNSSDDYEFTTDSNSTEILDLDLDYNQTPENSNFTNDSTIDTTLDTTPYADLTSTKLNITTDAYKTTTEVSVGSGQTILYLILIIVGLIIVMIIIYCIVKYTVFKNIEINVKELEDNSKLVPKQDDKKPVDNTVSDSVIVPKADKSPIQRPNKSPESVFSDIDSTKSEKPNAVIAFTKTALGIESPTEVDNRSEKSIKSDESIDTITYIQNQLKQKS